MKQTETSKRLMSVAYIVAIGGILFGINTAVINGADGFLQKDLGLDSLQIGIVSSSLTLAAAFGAMFGGSLSDKIGRKKSLRLIAWIFFIGAIMCAFSPSYGVLVTARLFLGLAVGSASSVVPLYLGEISSAEERGKMVGLNQISIVGGQFLAFVFNAIIGNVMANSPSAWKFMMGVAAIPAIIMIIGMTKVFETPKWLAKDGQFIKAVEVIKSIYTDETLYDEQIRDIEKIEKNKEEKQAITQKQKIPRWAIKVLLIGCMIGVIQQFVGINAIMYYSTRILQIYGFDEQAALTFNVLNGVICVVASLIGMLIVDKMGRKKLITLGLVSCAVLLVLVSLCGLLLTDQPFTPYVVLALIILYIFAFQGTLGPVPWILISEIFPTRYRGTFSGIATFVLWLCNFLVGLLVPVLIELIGINILFFIFAGVAIFGVFFINLTLPETKGKSFEEIELYFSKGS
ncbi:sugar porter family MFS transporter [Enterococcus faecium]|uniref:sugar porter family MFS transporter n=1 Tax=Enterococcus faecium TaxID=1352 RepID=UPI00338F10C4